MQVRVNEILARDFFADGLPRIDNSNRTQAFTRSEQLAPSRVTALTAHARSAFRWQGRAFAADQRHAAKPAGNGTA